MSSWGYYLFLKSTASYLPDPSSIQKQALTLLYGMHHSAHHRCSDLFSIAVTKHSNQYQCGDGRGYLTYTPRSQSVTERSNSMNQAGTMPTGLVMASHSVAFLIVLRLNCLGMAPVPIGQTLLYQLAIKKMSCRHAHRLIWCRQFCSRWSLFPSDFSLCQISNQV